MKKTHELIKTAGAFVKAVKTGTSLGRGDIRVLAVIKNTMPRLSIYHLVLAILFFASSIAVPFIVDTVFTASAGIASIVVALSTALKMIPVLSLFIIAGLFAAVLVVGQVVVNKARKRILGFPLPIPIDILGRQFQRMKMYVGILHHHPTLREPQPEETEQANKRDIEEHPVS